MTEQMTALAENYPAAAELLRRHGGETLLTYLGQLHHRPLPDILPSEDLLTEVRDYFTPFFGAETAGECADVLRRRRCLSTANHHHPAFEYMTVQDTILCDRWLRTQGETGAVVPFLSCANPRLDNNVYPRGMLVYDCTAPGGCLRLPFYPFKLRHACVAAVEGISPDMVDNALDRLRQEMRRGSCSLRTADALERFCREVLLSDRVQRCGTLREQTTVINAMLSQRYFTDRAPQSITSVSPLCSATARKSVLRLYVAVSTALGSFISSMSVRSGRFQKCTVLSFATDTTCYALRNSRNTTIFSRSMPTQITASVCFPLPSSCAPVPMKPFRPCFRMKPFFASCGSEPRYRPLWML